MAIEFGLMGQATVQLEDSVLHMFQSQVQGNESDNESGGQLFARFDNGKTIITIATPPRPTDRRWRYRPESVRSPVLPHTQFEPYQ
jgi:hypothetical protein